jgi:hypothetical protein
MFHPISFKNLFPRPGVKNAISIHIEKPWEHRLKTLAITAFQATHPLPCSHGKAKSQPQKDALRGNTWMIFLMDDTAQNLAITGIKAKIGAPISVGTNPDFRGNTSCHRGNKCGHTF